MSVFSIGLNHVTAPIGFREQIATIVQDLGRANQTLSRFAGLAEVITISTCNRVEIYAVGTDEASSGLVFEWLKSKGIPIESKYFYIHTERAVVSHLFRVVSSLDSMMLGENQIISQVRSAFQTAETVSSVGPVLRRIFERAFSVAKRVRTDTKISEGSVSIGRAGVDLSKQVLGDISSKTAMIIGAGEHGQLIANNLKDQGLTELYIANRTIDRAVTFAHQLSALPIRLSEVNRYLERCDIVVASIGGGQQVIDKVNVERSIKSRRYKSMVFIDLSMPRVFERSIHSVSDAYLFDVDDLKSLTIQGLEKRKAEAEMAEQIVEVEVDSCWTVLHSDRHNQSIGAVFQNASTIVEQECHRLVQQVDLTEIEIAQVKKSMNSIVKKILHHPVQHAQKLVKSKQGAELQEYLSTLIEVDVNKSTKE